MSISPTRYLFSKEITIQGGTPFDQKNLVKFPATAASLQITNNDPTHSVQVKVITGHRSATFTLYPGSTQTFAPGEIHATAVDFANPVSGAGAVDIQVFAGIVV
jgi:hypothetical protein